MKLSRYALVIGVSTLGLVACGGDKNPGSSSESANSSSSSQASSNPQAFYPFKGEWVLTRVWESGQGQDLIQEPYYLSIDGRGEMLFHAKCGEVTFIWDESPDINTDGAEFDATATPAPDNACNDNFRASKYIQWISEANLISITEDYALKISNSDFYLRFENYPVPCNDPAPWPDEQAFSPNVTISFETALLANQGLKDFVLNYEDFAINSWGEACTPNGQENVNLQLNIKTLNILRCQQGVTSLEFMGENGGEL